MLNNTLARINSAASLRFGRFLIVGVFNSAVGYGLFAGLVSMGLMPEAALLIATVLGVICNFVSTGRIVFGNRDHHRILHFLVAYGGVYVFNAAALRCLTMLAVPPLLAQIVLMPIAAGMTFVALRSFVFREKSL